MRFQIGDRVRHAIGTGMVLHVDNTDATLRIDFGCEQIFWVHQRDCSLCDALTLSPDEPPNFTERLAWWRELMPMWSGVPRKLGCTTEILATSYVAWDCELSPVNVSPLTVEADGDPAITCDLPHYPWQRFGGPGRWDNTFIDGVWRTKWYLTEHGELSHVQVGEVTL